MESFSKLDDKDILLLEFNRKFENLKAIIEFIRIRDEKCEVKIYNYFIIKFSRKGEFWDRIKYLSKLLDTLYNHALKFKSNKKIVIKIGINYTYKNCKMEQKNT